MWKTTTSDEEGQKKRRVGELVTKSKYKGDKRAR
jgi:hypothetical protein